MLHQLFQLIVTDTRACANKATPQSIDVKIYSTRGERFAMADESSIQAVRRYCSVWAESSKQKEGLYENKIRNLGTKIQ